MNKNDAASESVSSSEKSEPAAKDLSQIKYFSAPHWSLIIAALMLFGMLLYTIREFLTPLTLSVAMIILLYPSRRVKELRPLLMLVFIVLLISLWWRLSALFVPFILAFILAYAIDPLVEWLVNRRFPRLLVIFGIIILILGSMTGIGILIVPKLINEISDLASKVPKWIEQSWKWITTGLIPWVQSLNLPIGDSLENIEKDLPKVIKDNMGKFAKWSSTALTGAVGVISGIANFILIPILTIYFLNEFKRIKYSAYNIIPDKNKNIFFEIYQRLNQVFSAYIRGQLLVCLFLATWISLGLWLFAGIPFALLLGISAGFANLIPYIGTATAGVLTSLVALTQPDPIITALKALAVFFSAQFLEGNLITPRIVGEKVGLHPLLVIFVVLLFASLFGLIGMLIAIPVTASIKEMISIRLKHAK